MDDLSRLYSIYMQSGCSCVLHEVFACLLSGCMLKYEGGCEGSVHDADG